MPMTGIQYGQCLVRGNMRLDSYINEGREGNYDLKDLYKSLNKRYFGGSLPTIKLRWTGKLKRAVGKASVQFATPIYKSEIGGGGLGRRYASVLAEIPVTANVEIDMNSLKIGISTAFNMSVKDIKAVMLHEMVHIKLYTQKKIGQHHDTPEFDGWITKLRGQSGVEVPFKESAYKKSPKVKGKDGFVIIVHETSGRKGIATYTTQFMKDKWLLFAKTMTRIMNLGSGKVSLIEYFKINHPVIVVYPAKRSMRKISWTIVDDETIQEIKRKGKQWGYADREGGRISPHTVGMRDKDLHPIPIEIDKKGELVNLQDVYKTGGR